MESISLTECWVGLVLTPGRGQGMRSWDETGVFAAQILTHLADGF